MLSLRYVKYDLIFRKPAITSRNTMLSKPSWVFVLEDGNYPDRTFHGEVSVIPGLSTDDLNKIEIIMTEICDFVNKDQTLNFDFNFNEFPSVGFGFEMLIKDHQAEPEKILFPSKFTDGTSGISINGLIWMGDKKTMYDQVRNKLNEGWKCIKLKIGGLDFEEELKLLNFIRSQFGVSDLELRLDANGAFTPEEALEKLKVLSNYDIHSIEQPIWQGQLDEIAGLCEKSPVPVALDEELIGVKNLKEKLSLLETIKPQYIIIKPSLLGGWNKSEEWLNTAKELNIGYWITSALESNIGLNAIAQWTAIIEGENNTHGLGTGMLYTNNFNSPLKVEKSSLIYHKSKKWQIDI
jgi:O-succinylbenzoate synthase